MKSHRLTSSRSQCLSPGPTSESGLASSSSFKMPDMHLRMPQGAGTATLSSLYQMSLMRNEVTFDWWDILGNANRGF